MQFPHCYYIIGHVTAGTTKSIKHRSLMSYAKLTLGQILKLLFIWSELDLSNVRTYKEAADDPAKPLSKDTVGEWFKLMRDICGV